MALRKSNIILFILILSAQIFPQPFSKFDREILEATDTRSLSRIDFDYKNLNQKSDKNSFSKYFLAIMNIGDTSIADELIKQYKTSRIDNQASIIKLLGYLNSGKSREFLSKHMKSEKEKTLLTLEGISLGRIGLNENLNDVLNSEDNFAGKLAAFFQFGTRRISSQKVYEYIKKVNTYSLESGVDYEIAYIFNRTGSKETLTPYKKEVLFLTNSSNPFVRMWAYSALGKIQDPESIDFFLTALDKETDWRLRVNLCNALGNQLLDLNSPSAEKTANSLLLRGVEGASAHVSISAWQAIGKLFGGVDTRNPLTRKIQQEVQFILSPSKSAGWHIKAEAIRAYAKIFKDEIKDELLSLFSQTDDYDLKAAIVGAFANMDNGLVYKELRDAVSADVQKYNAVNPNKDGSLIGSPDLAKIYKAFVESLAELDNKLDDENKNTIRLIFSEFAASKNPAITDVCLTNLQDSMYMQYRGETSQVMLFDYNGFEYPKDKEVMLLYIQAWNDMKYDGANEILTKNLKHEDYDIAKSSADALKNMTGKNYETDITASKYRTDFDWGFLDKLNDKKFAVIKTNQGNIKIELFPEVAPFTIQNFVKLAEKGYYDNTIFHRVIANFVIQGGDPTGTGYGGPGYSIRSEFSPIPFDAYTVGMASSGKDTEGSQFFITHSPQPHLDARYTLFGKVTEGFDVVDKIQIGDKIENIVFSAK